MTLLAVATRVEIWDPFTPLYTLLLFGGLIVAAGAILKDIVRWFWSGDARFWWDYERPIWIREPRNRD